MLLRKKKRSSFVRHPFGGNVYAVLYTVYIQRDFDTLIDFDPWHLSPLSLDNGSFLTLVILFQSKLAYVLRPRRSLIISLSAIHLIDPRHVVIHLCIRCAFEIKATLMLYK